MRNVVRGLAGLLGLFNLVVAAGFLFNTEKSGAGFFLKADGIQGIATMRADMTSFFGIAAICALYAALKGRGQPLIVPALLFGMALAGRFISIAIDGAAPTAFMPMVIEAIMIAVSVAGYRMLDRG